MSAKVTAVSEHLADIDEHEVAIPGGFEI